VAAKTEAGVVLPGGLGTPLAANYPTGSSRRKEHGMDGSREAFLGEIHAQQREAEEALIRGDVEPRLQMWSHEDPVSVFAAVGPSASGWKQLEPMFRSVASRLSGGGDVDYDVTVWDVGEDTAWTAGFLRFATSMDGGPIRPYLLRITHIYRREGEAWKVVHEHSNWEDGKA
jgi:ketosteroid isomerase-like protein